MLSIEGSLVVGDRSGKNADWWVYAETPFGWYYYEYETDSWIYAGTSYTDLFVTYQGPLFDLQPYEVLNMSGLPEGTYTAYFGVDTNMNGIVDEPWYYDTVEVNISLD